MADLNALCSWSAAVPHIAYATYPQPSAR